MKQLYEYMLINPLPTEELPTGIVDYELYKDARGALRYWGFVVYDRPLTGTEIDHCNLDGPLSAWG